MSRKRFALLALPVAGALAAAGMAIAAVSSGAQAAAATFDATTISNKHQATCSANGGDTFTVTVATYTGTASSSDARLNGTIRLRVRSVIDTTTNLGRLDGAVRFKGSTGGGKGIVHAAVSDSEASGVVQARMKNPVGRLIASFAGSFDPDQGFSSGSIGGSSSGAGVVLSGGLCRAAGLHGNNAAHVRAHLKAHGH